MSQEYPLIKIQDMNSGDIVLDEKNEKMVVYVNSTCSLFTKDGMQRYPKPTSQYRLIQKKRFVCPLNQIFYIEEGLAVTSYENRDMWYQKCAIKGIEPKVKKTILTVPDCQKPVAAFQSFSEAIDYKAKQDEPHWFFICKDERGLWALTKSHVVHPDIEVVDETRLLKDKIDCLELDHQDLIHEITRLRETNLVNETSKNELFAQAVSHKQMIESLKGRIAVRDQEIELLKKHMNQLNTKHESEIQGVRQSLKATKEQYEANLKAKDEAFSTLQLQASDIENHRDKLLEDLEESRKKFETCEDHRRFLLKKVDEELQKVAFSNQQLQRVLAEKDELRHKLNNSLEQAKSLVGVSLENAKLKDRVTDLMEKNEELKGSLQILETKRVQLQCQLEREEDVSTKWHQEAVACRQKLEKLSALVNLHA